MLELLVENSFENSLRHPLEMINVTCEETGIELISSLMEVKQLNANSNSLLHVSIYDRGQSVQ